MFVILILLSIRPVYNKFPAHCNTPTGTVLGSTYHRYKEDSTAYLRVSAQSNIALKETLCYKISYDVIEKDRTVTKHRLYALELAEVSHWFNYKSTYQFAIPQLNVRCNCDCPGGSRQCSSGLDSCGTNKSCTNWFSDAQTTDGCVWVGGTSKTCCSVDVTQLYGTYRAVELATPLLRPRFILSVYDLVTGETLQDSHSFVIDPASGIAQLDDVLTLDITHSAFQSGTKHALPPGLYYGREGSNELRTNVRINKLNEWNYDKLGWMKVLGNPTIRQASIQDTFLVKTRNCGDNDFETGFAASYYNDVPVESEELGEYYFTNIETVQRLDDTRQVIVTARTSPRINVRFMASTDVKMRSRLYLVDTYHFDDFTAKVTTDRYSNTMLHLTLYNGVGSLSGYVFTNSSDGEEIKEDIFVQLSEKRSISDVKIPINSVDVQQVCLFNHTEYYCDISIERHREEVQRFQPPGGHIPHTVKSDNDVLRFATWRRAANVKHWFDSDYTWHEIVLIVLVIILVLGVIILTVTSVRRFTTWRQRRLFVQELKAEQAKRLKVWGTVESVDVPCGECLSMEHVVETQDSGGGSEGVCSTKSLLGQEVVQLHSVEQLRSDMEQVRSVEQVRSDMEQVRSDIEQLDSTEHLRSTEQLDSTKHLCSMEQAEQAHSMEQVHSVEEVCSMEPVDSMEQIDSTEQLHSMEQEGFKVASPEFTVVEIDL